MLRFFSISSAPLFYIFFTSYQLANASTTSSWSASEPQYQSVQPSSSRSSARSKRQEKTEPATLPFSPGSHNFGLQIGQVFLMGDLAKNSVDTLGYRLQYTYGVSELFGFNMTLGYSDHTNDLSILTFNSDVRINLSWYDRVVPYAALGLGFYNVNTTAKDRYGNVVELSPMLFGLHITGGANLILTDDFFIGANLDIHNIFTSTKTINATQPSSAVVSSATSSSTLSNQTGETDSVKVGGTFTTFLFTAGMKF